MESIKKFLLHSNTSKVNERVELIDEVLQFLSSKPDVADGVLRACMSGLFVTLGLYQDQLSRRKCISLIDCLLKKFSSVSVPGLINGLDAVAQQSVMRTPNRSESAKALVALSWTCKIASTCFVMDPPKSSEWNKLVEVQARLYFSAQASQSKSICESAMRKMIVLWKQIPEAFQKYSGVLLTSDSNFANFVLLGALSAFDKTSFESRKDDIISSFVKSIIICKVPVESHALVGCAPVVKEIDHTNFQNIIIPAMQKALLRSPENVLQTIKSIMRNVSIDLSRHALILVKMLAAQLISKNDANRQVAEAAVTALSIQCSDAEAVGETAKYLFGVLKGSEGKLSVAGQKLSVLHAIAGLSQSPIGGGQSAVELVCSVVVQFLPFLQQEVHEGTLVEAANAMVGWCSKLRSDVPHELIDWFAKAPALKVSTPNVRTAYIDCMIATFKMDNIQMVEKLIPYLLQSVEKASQMHSQVSLVTEALYASCILIKLENIEFKKSYKFNNFWTTILDGKKSLFTSVKFLQNASDDALLKLENLIFHLFLDSPQKMQGDAAKPYYKSLIHILLNKPWPLRNAVMKTIKKLIASFEGYDHCVALLMELRSVLELPHVLNFETVDGNSEASGITVIPRRYENALRCIVDAPGFKTDESNAQKMALLLLTDAYQPCIRFVNNHLWTDFLFKAKFDAHDFIEANMVAITNLLIKVSENTKASLAALADVVRIAPDVMMPVLTKELLDVLQLPDLSNVTRREYEIMTTPEGSLYNMAIIDSAPKIGSNKNVKRENKAYSYKDQLMEEELRKELELKKKQRDTGGVQGSGGHGPSTSDILKQQNLSKKQKEMVEQEVEKEAAIRKKLQQVDAKFQKACNMFKAIVGVSDITSGLPEHVVALISPLLSLLSSSLCSTRAQDLFVSLNNIITPVDLRPVGLQTAFVTLRLYKPVSDVNIHWCYEELDKNVIRINTKLVKTFQTASAPAATYCYFFPFLHHLLLNDGAVIDSDVEAMCSALRLVLKHVKVHAREKILQRAWIIKSMCKLIGTSLVQVQLLATEVLEATCEATQTSNTIMDEVELLLQALLSPVVGLRSAALKGLILLQNNLRSLSAENTTQLHIVRRVWIAKHDCEEDNQKYANDLWKKLRYKLHSSICTDILEDVQHHEPVIQEAAAASLHSSLELHEELTPLVLQQLIDIYNEKLDQPPPVLDQLGRVISESPPDEYQARIGVAFCLSKISPLLPEDQIESLFSFFVPDALGDRHPEVRSKMLDAALQAVNDHGKDSTSILLQVFEDFLKQAPTSERYDTVRQSVVILLGTLARHLDKDNPKVKPIVAKLTETLSTPSQPVQQAVANCLPALVPSIKADAPNIVRKLLVILLESDNYGERKGAAYGLAGMVKGLGIISFKQLDIMTKLTDAIQDKKNYRHREGALLAFEMFCTMLGRLFEPYIVHVLPYLLLCFGDGNQYVREAADNTARAVMRNLSAHGVRLVLPSLLNALNTDDSWRTKTGSAELLGAMAFCAPKQLSACLPSIVPKLCEVLTDSHPKVQKAGQQALKQIGSVIRNPEIQDISDVLLAALSDPSKKTSKCLHMLLNTKFVHFIDAPSLALILPVVERAFQDRSTDTRKMAAQIIGNMYSLTDEKDLTPYLPAIIPGLKNTLLDPVPEVRAIAAKALGAMVKGTGESQFEDLLPWLMEKLTSEQTSVDRSGAAQGLSEVLASLGMEKLDKLMPEVIKTAQSENILPSVRDGYIMLFVYLPLTFGDRFVKYIGDAIQPILKALADENEFVRATALCAGQRIIAQFAENAIPVLLPELEKGLFDDNWRIRLSSIQLLGDLLYHISGVTGKMSATGEEDDNFGTAEGFKALVETLGQDRRDLVLSGLYMGRLDVALHVRQSALHVWKIIVPNTPRILREILPTLFKLLLGCLASQSYDKRQVAAKTLGDIVRKLGERMLPELIPILERGLDSDEASQRQGVCIGLTEIIKSCSKDAIVVFTDNLVPTVRKALCDSLPGVRTSASITFEHLHNTIGVQALDEILPSLLRQLQDEATSEYAVDGLRQIIAVKGKVVLPFIVPKLIEPPVDTEVLAFLSSVAGEALTRHLPSILKAFLSALVEADNSENFSTVLKDARKVLVSVEGEHGNRIVIDDLLLGIKNQDPQMRYISLVLLHAFCKETSADFGDYVSVFMQTCIKLLADREVRIQSEAWDTLSAVTATLDSADMQKHISSVRYALRYVKNDEEVVKTGVLPGFCLPKKGLAPILPIFREGILNGAPDLKEQAAKGIGECIMFLTPAALKPSVVNITGPLIRILGDRFSSNVRIAVLETLSLLLKRVGVFLKPFLPQLQTTFSKALQDPNRPVRLQAGIALSHLSSIHTRVDPLFNELNNSVNSADDVSIRETSLQAMRGCIANGGKKLSEKVKSDLKSTLLALLSNDEDVSRSSAAGCLGNLCSFISDDELAEIITKHVLAKDASASWALRQGRSTLLAVILKEAPNKIMTDQWEKKVLDQIQNHATMDRAQIITDGIHAAAYLLVHYTQESKDIPKQVTESLKFGLEHSSNDMRIETARSVNWSGRQLARPVESESTNGISERTLPENTLNFMISLLLVLTREKNPSVRTAGEYAIVSLLKLRENEQIMQKCAASLPSSVASGLLELFKQKLKRVIASTELLDDIDNSIIKT
ncbi:unnamed protein product [Clavelina lepadiformis]|uniref:TOG domain-containing protein n=1 Tax=Clavelina lepadiformis TaxID=159417 RepID=A0ABP0GLZ0_CLALP